MSLKYPASEVRCGRVYKEHSRKELLSVPRKFPLVPHQRQAWHQEITKWIQLQLER